MTLRKALTVRVALTVALLTAPGSVAGEAPSAATGKRLVAAARAGDLDSVKQLLAQGVDPNVVDYATPLMAAVTATPRTERRLEIMRRLLAAGARVNAHGYDDRTALSLATSYLDVDAVRLLLDHGADPNLGSPVGYSLLLSGDENVHLEIIRLLVARGANLNIRAPIFLGATPVSRATQRENAKIVKLLLDSGADPDPKDDSGLTPLMYIVSRQHVRPDGPEIVRYLVAAGADVNAQDSAGRTVAALAASGGNTEMMFLLRQLGARDAQTYIAKASADVKGSLIEEARRGRLGSVRLLLDAGTGVNITDAKGWTPLLRAIDGRHAAIVEVLLSAGARVNAKSKSGWTPLGVAVLRRHAPIVRRLIMAGADVNAKTAHGDPILVIASQFLSPPDQSIMNREPEIVEALLDAGADPNARDRDELTPLMWVAAKAESTW